jgi:NadR type nicotinamide-nucleotide adenylyltransferase
MAHKTDEMIRKIAITGPESTGKSVLSQQLAAHYHTVWVPEYAREYLAFIGRPYVESDILEIAKGQLKNEKTALSAADSFLFCDTELIVTSIWSEVKYHRCDPWISENIKENPYDLYLLCNIDLPWEYDPLREHPGQRQFLFDYYTRELENTGRPFRVVSGFGIERLNNAILMIDQIFKPND